MSPPLLGTVLTLRYTVSSLQYDSSELRAAGFMLIKVISPALEAAARGSRRRCRACFCRLQGMGSERFVLSVNSDNEFKSCR